MIKKTIRCIICVIALLSCFSCRTLEMCEDVRRPKDLPWLDSIAQTGMTYVGQKLLSIDKITYTLDDSNTSYIGFCAYYEKKVDVPSKYIYNCDGEVIVNYGGLWGCSGECDLKILSSKNIYTTK